MSTIDIIFLVINGTKMLTQMIVYQPKVNQQLATRPWLRHCAIGLVCRATLEWNAPQCAPNFRLCGASAQPSYKAPSGHTLPGSVKIHWSAPQSLPPHWSAMWCINTGSGVGIAPQPRRPVSTGDHVTLMLTLFNHL